MKFTPLHFQVSVAAGGVALMPFVYLHFVVPHGEGLITLGSVPWTTLTGTQIALYAPLIGVMFLFTLIHLLTTIVFLSGLGRWLADREQFQSFINNPKTNIAIFSPIASLAMTANVVWGPLAFFVPSLSSILQGLMVPSLIFFGILWLALLALEFKVLKIWLSRPVDTRVLNFAWLLDVFAFGLVSLTGSGIAAMAADGGIASLAAFGTFFTISIGLFLFTIKITALIYLQIKAEDLPHPLLLPAYFLTLPIVCLFGIRFFRIMSYLRHHFAFEVAVPSFMILNLSYVIAVGWGIFCLYLLTDYLKGFRQGKFSPAQWGMV